MANSNLDYAEWVTDQYLYHAVQSIDVRLGEGYARKNPTLVSTMICLTAQEFERQNSLEEGKDTKKVIEARNPNARIVNVTC
jgi:hypothetical protein